MNIMLCTDKNYYRITKVLLHSIALTCTDKIVCYLISDCLKNSDIKDIKYNNIEIKLIHIDSKNLRGFPVSGHISPAAYYRIMALKMLPESVERILYLDCDIIVNGNLKEIYSRDFGGAEIIACEDKKISKNIRSVYDALGMDYGIKYFNSGVLLFNVKKIRSNDNFEKDIFEFVRKNNKKLLFHDQDVLNYYFQGKVKYINSKKYNCIVKLIKNKKEAKWAACNSVIIHFADKRKPWNYNYVGYLEELWWRNAKRIYTKEEYLKFLRKHFIYKILPFRLLRKIKSLLLKKTFYSSE